MSDLLTEFSISEEKMAVFRPMADPYGIGNIEDHWPNNVISTQTVIYEDGKFGLYQEPHEHAVEAEELELCRLLAAEAAALASTLEFASEASVALSPFFVTCDKDQEKPININPDYIEKTFAGTIFPGTEIRCEDFKPEGAWWEEMEEDPDSEFAEDLQAWRNLMTWFEEHSQLDQAQLVSIGDDISMYKIPRENYPRGTEMTGSCFPRLIVALTPKGSLVGLASYMVLT